MATRKVIILGGDGDDGAGHARIIDAATGSLLRDIPRHFVLTDRVTRHATHGNYYYLRDTDNTIACYDKDNVFVSKVDMGYHDGPSEFIWSSEAGIHSLKRNKNFETFTAGTENLFKIVTYAHTTLAVVSEVVLDAPELGDSATNAAYLISADLIFNPTETDFWVFSNAPVFTTVGQGFVKVGMDGTVLDTWEITDTTFEEWNFCRSVEGVYFYANQSASSWWWRTIDFSTKTFGDTSPQFELNQVLSTVVFDGVGLVNDAGFGFGGVRDVSIVGNTMRLMFNYSNGRDPNFQGGDYASGAALFTLSTDGNAVCNYATILKYQGTEGKVPVGFEHNNYASVELCRPVSDTDWIVGDRYGLFRLSATGTVLWSYAHPVTPAQAYSRDGEDIEYLWTEDWNTYTLVGAVSDSAGVASRTIRIHDQATGEIVTEVQTNGSGAYLVECFSNNPKYGVCPSVDDTENFEIRAHMIPTEPPPPPAPQYAAWYAAMGSGSDPLIQRWYGVATDNDRNVYLVGEHNPTAEADRTVLAAKYTPGGELLWQRTMNGMGYIWRHLIVEPVTGDVYLLGGASGARVIKYNADGVHQWSKSLGAGMDTVPDAEFLSNGNIAVASSNRLTVITPTGTIVGAVNMVVGDYYLGLGVDSSDNVYISTEDGTVQSISASASFGTQVFSVRFTDNTPDSILHFRGLHATASGDVYIGGHVYINDPGRNEVMLAKLTSTGTLAWVTTIGDPLYSIRTSNVTTDAAGNVYIIAEYADLPTTVGRDALIVKYAPNGGVIWQRRISSALNDYSYGIAVDSNNDIVFCAEVRSPVDNSWDAVVFKIQQNVADGTYGNFTINTPSIPVTTSHNITADAVVVTPIVLDHTAIVVADLTGTSYVPATTSTTTEIG